MGSLTIAVGAFSSFNDILENGPHSPWLDWFKVENWPLSAYDGSLPANYVSWVGNRALPEFNHDNPAVREYIMRVGEYWIRQGIDGWRLDVPYEVETAGFWQEFRDRIKAMNPEAYIVGEIWTDAQPWLDGTQFDGVMNYPSPAPPWPLSRGIGYGMDLVEKPHYDPYPALDATGYGQQNQALLHTVPLGDSTHPAQPAVQPRCCPSPDSVVGDDLEASLALATLLLITFPGAPSIYYGDEVGLPGALDPDCRRTFPAESAWNRDILDFHKALIALRHQHPALRTGTYQVLHAADHTYSWTADKSSLQPVFSYGAATYGEGTITLPPRSALVATVAPEPRS
jgi:cyclomaltodextrinase